MATTPINAGRLIFQEAIAAFAQRQRLQGTARYDDIRSEEHYRAFAVAGAMKADLLADLREAVRRAIEDGVGIEEFRQDFWKVVKKHGWHGWTGQGTEAGEAWRTRVIYTTNIRKSHSAGRYAQLTEPAFLAEYPYWQWVHSGLAQEPRTHHLAWDGMTLHHSDPFWRTHFPPRIPPDYGCTCRVKAVRKPAAGAQTQAPAGWQQTADVGAGAPPNFVAESIRYFVEMKGQKLPPLESAALREAVQDYQAARAARVTVAPAAVVEFAAQAKAEDAIQMVIAPVTNAPLLVSTADVALDMTGYALTLDNSGVLHAMRKHGNAKAETSRGQIALTFEDFGLIAAITAAPDAVWHDGKNQAGRDVLMLDKQIAGIGYRLALEIRPGRKTLTFLSLRKKPRAWRGKSEE